MKILIAKRKEKLQKGMNLTKQMSSLSGVGYAIQENGSVLSSAANSPNNSATKHGGGSSIYN